jgi:hypothetical protein
MPMVGRSNVHRIDIGPGEQFTKIVIRGAVAVVIALIDALF